MRRIGKVIGAVCLVLSSDSVAAQERAEARGYKAESAFEIGEIDSINLFNGALTLELPIGGRYNAGGSMSYGLSLVYNSSVWDVRRVPLPEEPDCEPRGRCSPPYWRKAIPNPVSNAGLGWLLTPGSLFAPHQPSQMQTDYHLLSVFVPPVDGELGGTVSSHPAGISCGSEGQECQASFQEGEVVLLTPVAEPGWQFDSWGGDEDCFDGVVTMVVARSCAAAFSMDDQPEGFDLTVQINPSSFPGSGSGRVVSMPAGIDCRMDGGTCIAPFAPQSTITLVAVPDSGSVLTSWNYICEEDPEDTSRATVELIADSKCVVRFDEVGGSGPYDLTVRGGGGTVYVTIDGENLHTCPADEPECSWPISGQVAVRLSAEHPDGLELRRWQPEIPCGVTDFPMVGDGECTAIWVPRPPERSPAALAEGEPINERAQWMYLSPDGARHLFYDVLQPDEDDFDDSVHYSRDNTYLRLRTAEAQKKLEFPDGSIHRFEDVGDGVEYRLTRMEDRFGNFLKVSYHSNGSGEEVWTMTDSTGRSHSVHLGASALGSQVDRVELATFGGRRGVYRFHYEERWIDRDCRDNDPTTAPRVRVPLLVEIDLPEGGTVDLRDAGGEPRYQFACAGSIEEPPPVPPGKWHLSVLPFGSPGNEGWISSDAGGISCTLSPDGLVSGTCSASLDPGESASLTAVPLGSSTDYEWARSSHEDCPLVSGEAGEAIACNARFSCQGTDCGGICEICPSCCDCDGDVCFPRPLPDTASPEANESGPSGALRGLRLPTGGQIEWDYGIYRLPSREAPFLPGLSGVREKRLLSATGDVVGRWTYDSRPNRLPPYDGRDEGTWPTATSTDVVTPIGSCSRHHFSGRTRGHEGGDWTYGLPFSLELPEGTRFRSSEVFAESSNGRCAGEPLRSTSVRYVADAEVVPGAVPGVEDNDASRFNTNRRLEDSKTIFHDDGGRWIRTERSQFNGLGNYRLVIESGNLLPGDRRETYTGFTAQSSIAPAGRWLLELFDRVEVSEGEQSLRTQYVFEPSTGFLECRRTLKGDRRGTKDVLVIYQRDGRGNTVAEEWFGGDTQRLGTASVCSASGTAAYRIEHAYGAGIRKRSWFAGSAVRLLDLDIDAASGLPRTRRDVAGVPTELVHDREGRLLEERPRDGACANYSYTAAGPGRPARIELSRSRGSSGCAGEVYAEHHVDVDGFGRPLQERRKMPGLGWVVRRTSYNALGWKTAVSAWGSTAATRFESFDPLGRPGRIELPGGAEILFDYRGDRVTKRSSRVATDLDGQSLVSTSEFRDSFGRLVSVEEPAGPSGSFTTTSYDYDVGGRLARVTAGSQVRRFDYDARGFLRSRTSPEKGGLLGRATTFGEYDARGLPGRMRDGDVTLDYSYDAAGRLREVWFEGRLLEERRFDRAPGSGLGRLWQAVRHNRVRLPGTTEVVDIEVASSFEYRGPDGLTSARELTIGEVGFRQTVDHGPLGLVSRLTYPSCERGCGDLAQGIGEVRYGYESGFLAAVGGWLDEIDVHPSGLWSRAVHANGVADLQIIDDRRARPVRLRTDGVVPSTGGTDWDSGEFDYDDSGNIVRIGPDRYRYDAAQRLAYASVGGVEEAYTYDRHGNLTSVTHDGAERRIMVDSATNRLAAPGVAYDTRGQLTAFNGLSVSLEWNALGRISELRQGENVRQAFVYDSSGERVLTIDPDQGRLFTLRDLEGRALRFVRQLSDGEWRLELDNVFAGDRLIGFADDVTGVRHVHLDHLGTPRLHTDAVGRVVAAHGYLPFGLEITDAGQDAFPLRFTSHERDALDPASQVDDLDYAHARRFSPWWGRFLSTDTVAGTPTRPQSWNRYAYVQNQPVSFRDRTGAYREDFHGEVTELLSLAAGYSPSMARAIAAATLDVDDGRRSPFVPWMQRPFHFTSIERRLALLESARAGGVAELGTLLHAVQDSYSHAGVDAGWSNPFGHAGQTIRSWLGQGPDPDSTQDDPGRALDAARMSYSLLSQIGGEGNSGLRVSFAAIQPGLRVALSSTGSRRQAAIAQIRRIIATERSRRLQRAMIGLSLLRF